MSMIWIKLICVQIVVSQEVNKGLSPSLYHEVTVLKTNQHLYANYLMSYIDNED